ncbi:P-loop containing nucleoside triphosphate hydrolase protein [Hesseltinella vesiculosa]|uniref:P-loop containing nucleoside triphosphate hydrolase protein n=1 Tax=Hesseltinella vesiculosa TaxID=101127 RepID=A0A1X2GST1_9FUNG|nr:P-loop containing nucleoside triphosphate hydrolase protein [Hesseltinella vesiculosa]
MSVHDTNPDTLVISALGAVGTGKSSLLNAIAGSKVFEIGSSTATTVEVDGLIRPWAYIQGTRYAHLIDTPGLSDYLRHDRHTVQEMVKYFRKLENGVSAFLLVFNAYDTRLDAYIQSMLQLFEALLGKSFWNFVVIVFTHVDEDSLDDMEEHIDKLNDPQDGFVAEIRRLHNLSPRSFMPSMIFTSNQNVRMSQYAQRHVRDIYNAVRTCESRNNGRRFTCNWLHRIRTISNEEEKASYISTSIRDAWSSVTSSVCRTQ